MPPQQGVFVTSGHKGRAGNEAYDLQHQPVAGPSSRPYGTSAEDSKKEKRRRDMIAKISKEISERNHEAGRHYAETISDLHSTSIQLSTRPETLPAYTLALYPISVERGALLSSLDFQERHALQVVQTAYDEERERVEEEWKRGRDRIRERLLEGVEERRRRAREEKDGEGTVGDGGMDSQSRPHITRKLRNKMGNGTSPPPTPVPGGATAPTNGTASGTGAVNSGPFLNPHSLAVDELPSPFPLPLTATHGTGPSNYSGGAGGGGPGRRRAKGSGREPANNGGLNKSVALLNAIKEADIEADLGEIRRGNKRRRTAVTNIVGKV